MMYRNPSVDVHQFAMVPRADIPRSRFRIQSGHKTSFDSGYLVPIYEDEVLPGDSFSMNMTAFCRLATPIFPFMDNLYLDTFWVFVPNRLVWDNWQRFMGEQTNPGDSIDYTIPECVSQVGGYAVGSLQDYFGLPTVGQVAPANAVTHSALFLRAYNLTWNEWFRDENLQSSVPVPKGDGPDGPTNFILLRRGKRHDYFTSCLPWPQKGAAVTMPLGVTAPIVPNPVTPFPTFGGAAVGASPVRLGGSGGVSSTQWSGNFAGTGNADWQVPGLLADLTQATAATINQLRLSFQVQKLLERDARGGTRYTELLRAHFGVFPPDFRLQRPEILATSSDAIVVNPVAQTSGSPGAGGYTDTPQGNLAGIGTGIARCSFTQSFTEHGILLGLASVRADLNYQQGLRRMWSRRTRYDFYFPAFAMLGEQAVLNKEIYSTGDSVPDNGVFGYQERWGEMRYHPSKITSLMRSTSAQTIDAWHLAQHFVTPPVLNDIFIQENPPVERVVAVGAGANGQQFLFDGFFDVAAARAMPLYSVPGLIDHF